MKQLDSGALGVHISQFPEFTKVEDMKHEYTYYRCQKSGVYFYSKFEVKKASIHTKMGLIEQITLIFNSNDESKMLTVMIEELGMPKSLMKKLQDINKKERVTTEMAIHKNRKVELEETTELDEANMVVWITDDIVTMLHLGDSSHTPRVEIMLANKKYPRVPSDETTKH